MTGSLIRDWKLIWIIYEHKSGISHHKGMIKWLLSTINTNRWTLTISSIRSPPPPGCHFPINDYQTLVHLQPAIVLANQFITVCVPVERHKCGDPSPLVVSQRGRCNWLLSGQKGTSTRTRTFGFHYVISIDRSVLYTLLKLGEGKKQWKSHQKLISKQIARGDL